MYLPTESGFRLQVSSWPSYLSHSSICVMPVYLYCIATSSGLGPSFRLTPFRSSPSVKKILLFPSIFIASVHLLNFSRYCENTKCEKYLTKKVSMCVVCVQRCSDLCRSEAWSSELNALLNVDNFNKSSGAGNNYCSRIKQIFLD